MRFIGKSLRVYGRSGKSEAGFTLFEMVLALTFAAVIFAVASQFLYSTLQLQKNYDKANQQQHLFQVLYQVLNRDFAPLVAGQFLPEPALVGEQYEVTCWNGNVKGLLHIKYRYDASEQKLYRSEGFWGSEPKENLLCEDIEDLKFEYYNRKDQNWLLQWKPDEGQISLLPAMIRMTIKTKRGEIGPIVIGIKTNRSEADNAKM